MLRVSGQRLARFGYGGGEIVFAEGRVGQTKGIGGGGTAREDVVERVGLEVVRGRVRLVRVLVGVLLITDYMTYLNTYVLRFTPDWLLKLL